MYGVVGQPTAKDTTLRLLTALRRKPKYVNFGINLNIYIMKLFRWVVAPSVLLLMLAGAPTFSFGQLSNCFSTSVAPPNLTGCENVNNFIPQPTDPVKTVKIAFHIMQRAAPLPKDNFDENNPNHVAFLNNVANRANELFTFCNIQWCNCAYQGGLNQQRDSRIRFELTGIYYHRDNFDNDITNLY
jgi:hypothetical protein